MYAAKADRSSSRGGFRLYQREMTDVLEEQLRMEDDLRRALAGDELRLYVQPRFELARRRFSAYEALVRWRHPDRGLLLPDAFLGVAERAGLLPHLDTWVLRHVTEQLSRWDAEGKTDRLSCNVSAASFYDDTLLRELSSSLGENPAVASRLELEITENLLLTDLEGTAAQLRELKTRFPGVRVAIDDFGSGYSSLAYLRQLPVDTLKIDRAFVKDLDHSDARLQRTALAVIRTVIALGRDLDFQVVAEGAETHEQLGMLTALGVDEVQGYVLGKPQPLSEVDVKHETLGLPKHL
jgi:EAL domain-containing protein (putative c-di-GMP-specific phosphodiesterase class I)